MTKEVEKRTLQIRDVETNDDGLTVTGYVNKAGSISEILSDDGLPFQEQIQSQAFTNALNRNNDKFFYLEHDDSKILASTNASSDYGKLTLTQDDVGLKMKANIVQTTVGEDAYKLIKSGIISSMSFGFIAEDEWWSFTGDVPMRTVTDLTLFEVSAVTSPAYLSSEISARCKDKSIQKRSFVGISTIKLEERSDNMTEKQLSDFSDKELEEEFESRKKEKRDSKYSLSDIAERLDQIDERDQDFMKEVRDFIKEPEQQDKEPKDEKDDHEDSLNKTKKILEEEGE